MKRITLLILTATAAFFFAACGGPAANAPANNANTNTNTAKPTTAAPTADALLAMDKQANDAYLKGDSKFFEGFLSDKFVMYPGGHRTSKADAVAMISKAKCDVKDWKLEDPQMSMIDADTYVISYKGTFDGTCNDESGKMQKIQSPIRSASVFVRSGDKWLGAFHGENPIIDPKNPPKAEPKKEEPKKDVKAAGNSNTAANNAAPAKPPPDPDTDATVKIQTSGGEAFKAKDPKKFVGVFT